MISANALGSGTKVPWTAKLSIWALPVPPITLILKDARSPAAIHPAVAGPAPLEAPEQPVNRRLGKQVTMLYPKSDKEYKTMYQVEQQTTPALSLIAVEQKGDYMQIGQAFEKLSMMAGKLSLINDKTRYFGIYYDDPKTVKTGELRSKACITVDLNTLPEQHEFEVMSIPAANSVSLLFKGDYPELEKPYDWLFGEYLPSSQYQLKDFPPFEEYLNDLREVAPQDLLTRIHCLVG